MEVITPGHEYALNNQANRGKTVIRFYMDPRIHNGETVSGPISQEYIRALIDRVKYLDKESPAPENPVILFHLRQAILQFELRASRRKLESMGAEIAEALSIENHPTGKDGHIAFTNERMIKS